MNVTQIKKLLEDINLTIKELSIESGYSYRYLWAVLNGRHPLSKKCKLRMFLTLNMIIDTNIILNNLSQDIVKKQLDLLINNLYIDS